MGSFSSFMQYSLKKRKRSLLSALCCIIVIYAGVQLMYLHHDYSPLQLLSSVENEASRLMRFMGQVQVHCNNSVATNNNSMWMLCLDPEFGQRFSDQQKDDKVPLIYSIGPSADYNFEYFVSKNLSSRLYIFSHLANKLSFLVKANPNSNAIFKTTIVPNDPADFARNSFETQTLNSVMVHLKHKKIDILKIDTLLESVLAHEVLHFLIEDGVLTNVKELHLVIKLDKLDEDYIYSWYRVLYALFHTAGFRLYHTATSEPLCLQDTMMESCKYYLSFVQMLPPQTFVIYPPAIDGSLNNEMERITSFLDVTFKEVQTLPVMFQLVSLSHLHQRQDQLSVKIFKSVIQHNTHPCQVTCLLDVQYNEFAYEASIENPFCDIKLFAMNPLTSSSSSPQFSRLQIFSKDGVTEQTQGPEYLSTIQQNLSASTTNIMYIELDNAWDLLATLSSLGIPKLLDQLIIKTFIIPTKRRPTAGVLRKRFSELKRIEAFQMKLIDSVKMPQPSSPSEMQQHIHTLTFVKNSFL